MPFNPISGKSGSVLIGTTSYSFGKWSANMHAKLVPVPNFNGGGAEQYVVGLVGAKITLDGPYDLGNMPFTVGTQYNWIFAYTNTINFPLTGIIESIEPTVDAEGAEMVKVVVQSNGTFTPSIT